MALPYAQGRIRSPYDGLLIYDTGLCVSVRDIDNTVKFSIL